jgi:carboxymethylenebutenolidase
MDLNYHQRYVIEEFADDYKEHKLGRRELLRRVLFITGSVPLTASVLFMLGCGDSSNDEPATPAGGAAAPASPTSAAGTPPGVPENDPAIQAGPVEFPGPASTMKAYVARPRANGTYPGVMIIHENAGMLPHFTDVARRYAKEGFVGLAVDLVSRLGGTSTTDPAVNMAALRASTTDMVADLQANWNYLKAQPFVKANAMGVTGFCFGGGLTWQVAARNPEVKAAVPYYGPGGDPEMLDLLGNTKAAVLAMYGETDQNVNRTIPQVEEKLKASGRPYEIKIWPGAGHAFFNDTRMGTSYNEAAATGAWPATLAWFRKYLTG